MTSVERKESVIQTIEKLKKTQAWFQDYHNAIVKDYHDPYLVSSYAKTKEYADFMRERLDEQIEKLALLDAESAKQAAS